MIVGVLSCRRKSRILSLVAVAALGMIAARGALAETRTVRDGLGRQVRLPLNPRRIVALAPSITETIFALGQEERLVGVTRFSDYPPEAQRLPNVGSYVHLDPEKIVSLSPDLCIAVKDGNPREVVQLLESFNIPVYAVNPRNLEGVMDTLLEIGMVLGTERKARELVDGMQQRIAAVRTRVSKTDKRPGVFLQIGISPIVAVGTDTFIHELIELAGGRNLTAGPLPYPRFSREQIVALRPEVFIITSMARGTVFDRVKSEWSRWPDIPAIKNDRLYLVDSNLFDRTSPRLVDALEVLARLIHPDLMGETP